MADTPVSINNFIYDEETYSAKYDKDFFVIPFISMNDGHTPAQIRTQNRGLYKDIQRAPFLRKSGVFTEDGTINDIDITSLVYYGTLEQSKIAPTLENIDIKLYFREPKLTKVPDTVNSGKYADSYIWREVQPGFHVYNNDTVYGYEWMILQDDYVHTDGVYNLHMNIEDGLGVCKFAGTQAPISLKGIQYKIVITAKNLWTREFSLIDSMPLIKSLNSVTDDLAPSVKAVREYYEKALETLKVVTETLTVKTEDDVWLETRKDEETGREYIYIKDLQLGEIPNIGELVTTLIDDLSDHVKDAIDDAATDEKGELIGVHGIQNKGIKGNLNAKKLDGATLSNGMQGVEEDVNELSYIPYVDDKNTIGLGTVINQYSRSSGKDPIPVYRTILESQDSAKTLRLKRYSLDTDLTELLETVAYGANTINYRFTKTDSVPTIKITSGKNEEANAALNVSCVFTDKIDFGGYADKKFVITAAKIAYWDGASSIAYKKMHSELIDTKIKTVNDFYNLTPNLSTDADGKPVTTQNTASLEDSNLLVPDFKSDLAAFTKLGSALQALYELPIGTYEYKRGSAEYKEQLGIFVERVNQVRDHLQELVGSGENENGMPTQDNFVVHKRNTWIKSKHANVKDRDVGLGDLADVRNIYTGRSDTNAYSYTSEEINSIVNYLNLVTSKDELGQEIRNTVGILLKAAKEAQERLLDVETAIYGWDAATVPGDDKAKKAFIDNHVAQNLQEQINNSPLLLGLNRLMRALLLEIYDTTDLEKLDAEIESRVTDSDSLEEKATVKSRMDQIDEIMSVLYSQQSAMIKFYVENVAKDEAMHTYTDIVSKDGKQRITKDAALTEEDPGVDLADDHSEEKDRDEGRTWRNLPSKEDITDEAKATVGFAQVADAAHRHTPNKDETGLIRVPILATKDTDNVSEGDIEHTDKSEYVPENSGETKRFWDLFKLDKYKNNYTDDYAAAGTYNPFFKTKAVAWEKAKLERINAKLSEVTKTIYGTDDVQASLPNRTEVLRRNITNLVDDLYPNRSFEIENPVETPTDLSAEIFAPFKNSKVQKPAAQSVATLNTDEPVKENHTSIIPWIDNEIFNFKIVNHYIGKRLKGAANSVEDYEHNKQVSLEDRENFNLIFDTKNLVTDAVPFNEDYGTYYKAYSRLDMLENLIGVQDCYITNLYADEITDVNAYILPNIDSFARSYTNKDKVEDLGALIAEKQTELTNLQSNEIVLNEQIEEQESKIANTNSNIIKYDNEINKLTEEKNTAADAEIEFANSAIALETKIGHATDAPNSNKNATLYANLNALKDQIEFKNSEKLDIESKINVVENEIVQINKDVAVLEKSKEAFERLKKSYNDQLKLKEGMRDIHNNFSDNSFKGITGLHIKAIDWFKELGINSNKDNFMDLPDGVKIANFVKPVIEGSVLNSTNSEVLYKIKIDEETGSPKLDENGNYIIEETEQKGHSSDTFSLRITKTYESKKSEAAVTPVSDFETIEKLTNVRATAIIEKFGNVGDGIDAPPPFNFGATGEDFFDHYHINITMNGLANPANMQIDTTCNVSRPYIKTYAEASSIAPEIANFINDYLKQVPVGFTARQLYSNATSAILMYDNSDYDPFDGLKNDWPHNRFEVYRLGSRASDTCHYTIASTKVKIRNADKRDIKLYILADSIINSVGDITTVYVVRDATRYRKVGEHKEVYYKWKGIKYKKYTDWVNDYADVPVKELVKVQDFNEYLGYNISAESFQRAINDIVANNFNSLYTVYQGTEVCLGNADTGMSSEQKSQYIAIDGWLYTEHVQQTVDLKFTYNLKVDWTNQGEVKTTIAEDGTAYTLPSFVESTGWKFPVEYTWIGEAKNVEDTDTGALLIRSEEVLKCSDESDERYNINEVYPLILDALDKAADLAEEQPFEGEVLGSITSSEESVIEKLDDKNKLLGELNTKLGEKLSTEELDEEGIPDEELGVKEPDNEEQKYKAQKSRIEYKINKLNEKKDDKEKDIKDKLDKLNEALSSRDKQKLEKEKHENDLDTAKKRKAILSNLLESENAILNSLKNNLNSNEATQSVLESEIAEARANASALGAMPETDKFALPHYLDELEFTNYSTAPDSSYRNDTLSADIMSSSNVGFVVSRKVKPLQARVTTVEAYLDTLAKAFAYADNLIEKDQEDQSELKTQANMSANKRFEVVNSFLSLKQVFNISEAVRKSTDHRIYDLDLSESLPGLELHNSKVFQALKFSRNASKTQFVLDDQGTNSGISGSYSITAEFIAETNTLSVQDVDYFTALALSKYGQFTIYVQYVLDKEKANITPENAKKNTIYLLGKAPTENLHKFWRTDNTLPAANSLLENAKGWQNQTEYNIYKTISNLFTSLLNKDKGGGEAPESRSGDNLYYQLMLLAHPIGSVYISMKFNGEDADPEKLFGGKWQKLEDGYLLPTNIAGNVNEFNVEVSKAKNLTVKNVPKHGHLASEHTHDFRHNHLFSGTVVPEVCDLDRNDTDFEIAVANADKNGLGYQPDINSLNKYEKAYTFTTTDIHQNMSNLTEDGKYQTGVSSVKIPYNNGIRNENNEEVETEPIDVYQIPHINVNAWVRIA